MGIPGDGQIRADNTKSDWGHSSLNFWDNDYDALLKIVQAMKPGEVEASAGAYVGVRDRMKTSVELIYKQASVLSENWSGDAAEKQMAQMQKLYDAARKIHDTSDGVQSALYDHATMQRGYQNSVHGEHWYGAEIGTHGTSFGDWLGGESHMGREIMDQLQNDTVNSNNRFPHELRADMPNTKLGGFNPNTPNPGGPTHVPTSGGPGGFSGSHLPGGTGSHLPTTGSHLPTSSGHLPGTDGGGHLPGGSQFPGSGSIGDGSQLAGFDPSGGGGGGLGGGGLGGGGLGDPLGGGGGLGSSGLGSGAGLSGGALGSGAGVNGGAGMAGRGMMPMAGGGHGQGEKERERSTWLTEDEDVWGADGDSAPPLIG